jgi:hypothetical protein
MVRGIDNLDVHTPRALVDLWAEFGARNDVPAGITTTVYHFGISEGTGNIHGTHTVRRTSWRQRGWPPDEIFSPPQRTHCLVR